MTGQPLVFGPPPPEPGPALTLDAVLVEPAGPPAPPPKAVRVALLALVLGQDRTGRPIYQGDVVTWRGSRWTVEGMGGVTRSGRPALKLAGYRDCADPRHVTKEGA